MQSELTVSQNKTVWPNLEKLLENLYSKNVMFFNKLNIFDYFKMAAVNFKRYNIYIV